VKASDARIAALFLQEPRRIFDRYSPRIIKCLRLLDADEIWWRPNAASNSAGNLVLHLCGNIRQWIISGLGGALDVRVRDKEFSERGPIPKRVLIAQLRRTVRDACKVLEQMPPEMLTHKYTIQGFHVIGLYAVSQVYEHFSHHAGQIIYLTKTKRGKDLRFTHLPRVKKKT
jgi:hypothetical protein